MKNGILISFEGVDGSGKTSVLQAILPTLTKWGREIVITREPGGVPLSESIRELIVSKKHESMDAKTELLLYIASRRQHLKERVWPALDRGHLVIIDRFIDSSVAYQGFGRGIELSQIEWMNQFVTEGLTPDLTIYFDISVGNSLKRITKNTGRELNRLDLESVDFYERVRRGYLSILKKSENRLVRVDADQKLERVIEDTVKVIDKRFEVS